MNLQEQLLQKKKIKSSLYSLYYAQMCNEFVWSFAPTLRLGNTAPFEEKSQRWQTVGNSVLDLIGPEFEPLTSRTRAEHVTALASGSQFILKLAPLREGKIIFAPLAQFL